MSKMDLLLFLSEDFYLMIYLPCLRGLREYIRSQFLPLTLVAGGVEEIPVFTYLEDSGTYMSNEKITTVTEICHWRDMPLN